MLREAYLACSEFSGLQYGTGEKKPQLSIKVDIMLVYEHITLLNILHNTYHPVSSCSSNQSISSISYHKPTWYFLHMHTRVIKKYFDFRHPYSLKMTHSSLLSLSISPLKKAEFLTVNKSILYECFLRKRIKYPNHRMRNSVHVDFALSPSMYIPHLYTC